jgi:aminoglycoside/choline kinase family phosphotransferase
MSRERLIEAFLERHGYSVARGEPLTQDASLRRYRRLRSGPRAAVLMDAPPGDIGPFLHIARHLAAVGMSVPAIFAADGVNGLLLEEDLGDTLLSALISPPPSAPFTAAVDALVAMQRAAPPLGLPIWDAGAMATTALATLFDWWWPAMYGSPAPNRAREDFTAALEAMLKPIAAGPVCFVHRDFFAGNLLWLPQRDGIRRIGVLDFQGASLGHPAYDLASLIQDARREIPPSLAEKTIAHYLAARPELDPVAFRTAYVACAAQRHLRIVGQWVRLARRDGRPAYLAYGHHTWQLLQRALREPAASPLASALDRWIPPERRRNPPVLAA